MKKHHYDQPDGMTYTRCHFCGEQQPLVSSRWHNIDMPTISGPLYGISCSPCHHRIYLMSESELSQLRTTAAVARVLSS